MGVETEREPKEQKKGCVEQTANSDECDDERDSGQGRVTATCRCCQYRWLTIVLATIGMLLMNGMRVNISVSVVMGGEDGDDKGYGNNETSKNLLPEVPWNPIQISFLHSVFYVGYLLTQVPAGIVAYKMKSHRIYGGGIVLSSILNLFLPVCIGSDIYWLVCTIRLLQGLCEGVVWPASYAILHHWSSQSEKNLLASILATGAIAGAIVGFPVSALIVQSIGWQYAFYSSGLLGVIWFVMWQLLAYEKPDHHPYISEDELRNIGSNKIDMSKQKISDIPWKSIAGSLPFAAICACHSAKGWVYILLLTQMPAYLSVFQFTVAQNGLISSLPFITRVVFSGCSGLFADLLMTNKCLALTSIRRLLNTLGLAAESVCFLALYFTSEGIQALALLTVGFGFGGLATAGWQINHLDLAPQYAGILIGLSSCFGNAAGIASPLVAGVIVHHSKLFAPEDFVLGDASFPENIAVYGWRLVFLISSLLVGVRRILPHRKLR